MLRILVPLIFLFSLPFIAAYFVDTFNKAGAKHKAPRLCVRHLLYLRKGQIALLDSDNCQMCSHKSIDN